MRDAELLDAWETARTRVQPLRGTALLAAADQGHEENVLAALPLGEVTRRLLGLHAHWFGRVLSSVCVCPACGVPVEAECDAMALCALAPEAPHAPEMLTVVEQEFTVRFRPPAPLDLAHAARGDNADAARRVLLERCVLVAERDGVRCAAADLPERIIVAVASEMESADPLADVTLALDCPTCGTAWTATLEPDRFLLAAVEEVAHDVIHEVHQLARAYGWSEAESLALSRIRRRAYLDLIAT